MSTFLLVRHAAHDWLGRGLAGRLPGVGLNEEGGRQAAALVQRLAGYPVRRILGSPQQRARETALPLAQALGLALEIEHGFDEIDFGDWTGRSFEQLRATGAPWQHWLQRRASARPPGGERFAEVPRRALAALRRCQAEDPDSHVVVVSHGDLIKAVIASCLAMSLDDLERFEIAPASLSIVAMGADWQQVRLVNGL